jgi:hypothetical protein
MVGVLVRMCLLGARLQDQPRDRQCRGHGYVSISFSIGADALFYFGLCHRPSCQRL